MLRLETPLPVITPLQGELFKRGHLQDKQNFSGNTVPIFVKILDSNSILFWLTASREWRNSANNSIIIFWFSMNSPKKVQIFPFNKNATKGSKLNYCFEITGHSQNLGFSGVCAQWQRFKMIWFVWVRMGSQKVCSETTKSWKKLKSQHTK